MVRLHVFGGIPMNRRRPTEGSSPSIVQLKVESLVNTLASGSGGRSTKPAYGCSTHPESAKTGTAEQQQLSRSV